MKRSNKFPILLSLAVSLVICSLLITSPVIAKWPAKGDTIFKLKDAALWIDSEKAIENGGECGGRVIWFSLPKLRTVYLFV